MPRSKRRRLPKGRKGDQTRKITVRRHSRSPRGSNAGKPRVTVKKHRRGRPRHLPG